MNVVDARGEPPTVLHSRVDATLLMLASATVGMIAVWLAFGASSAETEAVVTGIATPLVELTAAALIARAARSSPTRRIRVAWGLLAASMVVYAVGDAAWSWILIVDQGDPDASFADAAYVAFYPLIGAALLLFPARARPRHEAIRIGIDSAIVVVGGGMLVWHGLFLPALASAETDALGTALLLGYPVGDLVLLFGVATIALRRPAGIAPRALVALVCGLVIMFIADVAYGELAIAGAPSTDAVDMLYLGSVVTIALAGYLQVRAADQPVDEASVGWRMALPYAALAGGFGVLLVTAQNNTSGHVGDLLLGAIALTILVLVRQEFTNRENAELLADRVRRDSEARYQRMGGQATDAILLVDRAGVITYASPSLGRVLGLESAAILGRPVNAFAHADDVDRIDALVADTAAGRPVQPLEWSLWARDGVWRQVETVSANLLDEPTIGRIVLTTRDVRERRALTRQLSQAALHDLLTDLPNRILFVDRVGQALARARRTGGHTAILDLDLDGFTRINDSLGHAVGDLVLLEVARRVRRSIRASDTVARLAADEFAVLLDADGGRDEALEVADRIRAALREPLVLVGRTLELTAGIGIASTEEIDEGAGHASVELARNGHVALSIARTRGHDQVVVFAASMRESLEAQVELESDLRHAIAHEEFALEYQPIVDLVTRRLVGAEALVRWNHPARGWIAPNVFIPLAEETGLIGEIGTWVLRTACTEVARWAQAAPGSVPRVSVNLAASQVADPNLAWTVQSALAHAGAAPGWLTLELTERQLVQDSEEVLTRLHAIRALGVQISIDDFGTGYSSLAYLQQFPVNHIKIDRSFVTPLDDPTRGPGVAGAIVEIGRALGMPTIAEGIETELQLTRLLDMGCGIGQGYHLGMPQAASAMRDLVAATSLPPTSPPRARRGRHAGVHGRV